MMAVAASIHASAVLVGARAMLIRGPSGAGKSQLALALLQAAEQSQLPFTRLVSDDRTMLEAAHGRLLARPAPNLTGLIEVRGLGIRRVPYEPVAVVFLIVDLATEAARLPAPDAQVATIEGVTLPRLAIASGVEPLPLLLAAIATSAEPAASI